MICFPNCKINIGLYITGKRADGYHNLETVFYPLPARPSVAISNTPPQDVLEIVPANDTQLHISGLTVAGDNKSNLVWKAYELLRNNCPDKIKAANIFLHKVIPMGAGLGGGSADGAFMLRLLNDFFKIGLNNEQLAAYALQLGSDCPFFIYNTPQFATGRGEQMEPISLDLSSYSIQLICPKVHVSTAQAFGMIKPDVAPYNLRQLAALPINEWKGNIENHFEAPVFKQYPVLSDIKQQLYAQGAIYASMSGSGSAIYGVFPQGEKAVVKTDITFDSFYVA